MNGTLLSAEPEENMDKLFDRIFDDSPDLPPTTPSRPSAPSAPSPSLKSIHALSTMNEEITALQSKYLNFMQPQRDELVKTITNLLPQTTTKGRFILENLAKTVTKGETSQGDIRFDYPRMGGEWDWGYGRRVILLPSGSFTYQSSIGGRWEWLDYNKGVIALHWWGSGEIACVTDKPQPKIKLASLQWGYSDNTRHHATRAQDDPDSAQPPLSPILLAKMQKLGHTEADTLQKLQAAIQTTRESHFNEVMQEVKTAPLEVAEETAKLLENYKTNAPGIPGALRLAGKWLWSGKDRLEFLPTGKVQYNGTASGYWKWAGNQGGNFFVVLPVRQTFFVCRFSKSSPTTLKAIDYLGEKFPLELQP